MNVYVVLGEEEKFDGGGSRDDPPPLEWDSIYVVVVAKNKGQARYMAYRTRHRYDPVEGMPRMTVRLLSKDVDWYDEPQVLPDNEETEERWGRAIEHLYPPLERPGKVRGFWEAD